MRSTIIITIVALFGSSALANPQVNFYYEDGCGSGYAGSDYPGNSAIEGGPYGSKAAEFINSGSYPCGSQESSFRAYICGDDQCADYTQVSVGTCVNQYQSVYAKWDCGG